MTLKETAQDYFANDPVETNFATYMDAAEAVIAEHGLNDTYHATRRMAGHISKLHKLGQIDIAVGDAVYTEERAKSVDKVKNKREHNYEEKSNSALETFTVENPPKTLEDALINSNVDLDVWDVEKWIWNHWAKFYQVKVWFKRKTLSSDPGKALDKILQKYSAENGEYKSGIGYSDFGNVEGGNGLVVVNTYDSHLDKISLASTTDKGSSFENNLKIFDTAFTELTAAIEQVQPEMIVYPIGNDMYNTDDFKGHTTRGTELEDLSEPYESYQRITEVAVDTIIRLSKIAPVTVLMIAGNHDYNKTWTLTVALEIIFRDNPNVTINGSRHARKYLRYGNALLGFAHGDKQKQKITELPLMMAQENADNGDWGASKYRQFYCGDLHHQFTVRSPASKDFIGVAVKFMRSCGGNDTWHYDNGYIGVTKEMSFDVWSKDRGEKSSYKVAI